MTNRFLTSFVLLLSLAATVVRGADAPAAPASDDGPPGREWFRYPITAIPLAPSPNVNGQIVKGEWAPAAKLQDFVCLDLTDANGFAAPEATEVWLSYSAEALHVGFKVHMARGVPPLVTA